MSEIILNLVFYTLGIMKKQQRHYINCWQVLTGVMRYIVGSSNEWTDKVESDVYKLIVWRKIKIFQRDERNCAKDVLFFKWAQNKDIKNWNNTYYGHIIISKELQVYAQGFEVSNTTEKGAYWFEKMNARKWENTNRPKK